MKRTCLALALLPAFSLLLAGCGIGKTLPSAPGTSAGVAYVGRVFGGQQPIRGAHVYLFGVRGDQNGVSSSLLGTLNGIPALTTYDNPAGHGTDASGNNYVITDANGYFSFNGTLSLFSSTSAYACHANQLVYALAVGGDSGSGQNNSAIALMADLGPCMTAGLSPSLNINLNEVSTVAAAYALQGYMTGPQNVGYDNTPPGATGITNASANVAQMVDLSSGTALTTTPNHYGTVPTATINTLANILAACVNTDGSTASGSACGTLFANATSDGTSTGVQPTETVTAALNIARHPAANVGALFGLSTATPPFAGLATQPHDFTLAIGFAPYGLVMPGIPAVDAGGNVWFPDLAKSHPMVPTGETYGLVRLTPAGEEDRTYNVPHQPLQAAVDPSGNAWISTTEGGLVYETASPTTLNAYTVTGTNSTDDLHQIALDASGNVFLSDDSTGSLYQMNNSGVVTDSFQFVGGNAQQGDHGIAVFDASTIITVANHLHLDGQRISALGSDKSLPCVLCFPVNSPSAISVDATGQIWALNNDDTATLFPVNSPTAVVVSGGGLNTTSVSPVQPHPWMALDGAGMAWVANYNGTLSAFSSTGAALSPATGLYGITPSCPGQGLAIDGAGDVWVSCKSLTVPVLEYIGLATPVYTPLTPGHFAVKP